MKTQEIIEQLPYGQPFLFVDELKSVDEMGTIGSFTFHEGLDFFKGHFKDKAVVPGVILTECCAQIGLVCLGIYLLSPSPNNATDDISVALSSTEMEFYRPVFPGEKVEVRSLKSYFRFNKLKCTVKMYNDNQELVCKGVLAGMLKSYEGE
ncbi:3-hydroxyacyl-ACP dehydratase FabZ family protein [Muriicola sp. Z0-33]|uniref:3-hydroxyacyl-ACP dehydratase FabZ family protein n=1 Tax=Muriicola sp. Z0-33 TaxID=2816957 RepID=UPI002238A0A8|nr:FabA/FabZ family ACP-dehydratase [Muriicola sp. Z0-33]MCW5515313.1 hydroxymyristoyl-ACP dehydratase [Muriicola sp. Z0-33]